MKKQQPVRKVYKVIKFIKCSSLFFTFSFSLFTFHSRAGGFQIPQQSVKSMAFGGGFVSFASDGSILFYNPAGMCNLNGQNFTAGVLGLFPYVSLQTPSYDNIDQTSKAYTPINFYYVGSLCKNLRVGLGINNQFGSAASYPDTWEGMYIVQKITLKTFMFQPTIAYKFCDQLSLGAGFVYTLGTFADTKAIPVTSANENNGEVSISGNGHAFGYNLGIFSKIWQHGTDSGAHQGIQLGLGYRSGLPMTVPNGDVNFSQIPSSLATQFPASEKFNTKVNLPGVFIAGITFRFACKKNWDFALTYDFDYTMWKTYDSLHVAFSDPNTPSQGFIYNWKNATAHRMGIEATFMKKYSLRLGYYIDQTPTQSGYVSPEIVDANSSGICFGASVAFAKHYSVDVAYLRSDFTTSSETWTQENFTASYHRVINIFGIGVNYQF